ncbi:MAG TPA: extracellular solute-binding protein [Alphaproteobacteria bacterium]|jgi:iron(III) transport system substrate-binding protein|nr:extracellular solute-binding protein [Alphaproteobacteria bacterium]
MFHRFVGSLRAIALIAAFAVGVSAALFAPAWAADDWNTVVANARKEGVVVVHGAPGKGYNTILVGAFQKAYPDIKVQYSGAAGSVEVPKVLRERQAGIYNWDVWVSGPTNALGTLKDAGFFQPLRPLLRPENTADDQWIGGFAAGWMDKDQAVFYAFDGTNQNPVKINWDVIKKDQFTSLADLAKPEFAGKIVMHDPRLTGTGNGTSQTLLHNVGEETLKAIWRNNVVYTINGHQIAEWAVRGRYPIALGLEPNELKDFQSQGVGKNVMPVPDSFYKEQQISVGFGAVGFVDRAPHPNAAAVYINWLLSAEAQKLWVNLPRGTRRAGIISPYSDMNPRAGVSYFLGQKEALTSERTGLIRLAKETIDGAAPRSSRESK